LQAVVDQEHQVKVIMVVVLLLEFLLGLMEAVEALALLVEMLVDLSLVLVVMV
jgi:hypothetical protein